MLDLMWQKLYKKWDPFLIKSKFFIYFIYFFLTTFFFFLNFSTIQTQVKPCLEKLQLDNDVDVRYSASEAYGALSTNGLI